MYMDLEEVKGVGMTCGVLLVADPHENKDVSLNMFTTV